METDDEESDEDVNELDDIDGYDGFAGISDCEVTTNDVIREATNITGV